MQYSADDSHQATYHIPVTDCKTGSLYLLTLLIHLIPTSENQQSVLCSFELFSPKIPHVTAAMQYLTDLA